MLLNELGFLREQHAQFSKLGRQTLNEIESVLKGAKDADLREALHECYLALQVMRRSLFRAELAGWDTRALLDEWNEWMRAETFMTEKENGSLIKQERLELLRSELALRGASPKRGEPIETVFSMTAEKPQGNIAEPETSRVPSGKKSGKASDFFEDWDEDYRNLVEKELIYWTSVKETLERHGLEGSHALPLLKTYKKVHGEKKHAKTWFAPQTPAHAAISD